MKFYKAYIDGLAEELSEAIGEAENAEWHHRPEGDSARNHYYRLITWLEEVNERRVFYDDAKKRA